MVLKPMDPRILVKLLEGHRNVIGPLAAEREEFYRQQRCPRCDGEETVKEADPRRMIAPGEPLPRFQLRCLNCNCVWDPFTKVIEKLGNLGVAFKPAVPVIKTDD